MYLFTQTLTNIRILKINVSTFINQDTYNHICSRLVLSLPVGRKRFKRRICYIHDISTVSFNPLTVGRFLFTLAFRLILLCILGVPVATPILMKSTGNEITRFAKYFQLGSIYFAL